MKFIDSSAPGKPGKAKLKMRNGLVTIEWKAPKAKKEMDKAINYVVYRFAKGEKKNINNAEHILTITRSTSVILDSNKNPFDYSYLVTALDHMQNESKAVKVK